ncbi:hypothetical protein PNEG_00861 [Pneumocystis murina B123]|uniref:RAVE subunit 2/Rogdi n=1 Tax=Pneumocystis murina (strain B123) TaxID=1069680 RepID=M7NUC9_PNEMU|nr:hypothetical protein PNEG_00861 [Pneumocystis murina B123]EMR10711.1 hypothetical protein PNEG_00861 [Pneumocystis murina B123]
MSGNAQVASNNYEKIWKDKHLLLTKIELEWFISTIVPEIFKKINRHLNLCMEALSDEKSLTLVLSSIQSETIKGFLTRRGTSLIKGKFQIIFKNNIKLNQFYIKNTILLEQLSHLNDIICQSQIVLQTETTDADSIQKIINQLHLHIQSAQQILYPNEPINDLIYSLKNNDLDPPLPSNIMINICIDYTSIATHIYLLAEQNFTQRFSFLSRLFSFNGWKTTNPRSITINQQLMQIIDEIHLKSRDPALSIIIDHLTAIEYEVNHLKLNIDVLQKNINTSESTQP